MDKEHIDPIYDYIEISDDLLNVLNKGDIAKELKRIESINHLGIIQKIYTLSKHSKFEHALGVYYLSDLAETYIKDQLNKAKIQPFNLKLASLCHGIGHLPYTYATEKAINSLYNIDEEITSELNDITSFVCRELEIAGTKKVELLKFLKEGDYHDLHDWIEAYKILKNNDIPANNKRVVARIMVDSNDSGYKLIHFLDLIDFVIRDAHYINLFSLRMNLIPFMKGIKISKDGIIDAPSDVNVIGSYYDLLREKVYLNPKIIAIENIFSRIIIKYILNKTISFDMLLNWDDDELNNKLKDEKYRIGGNEHSLEEIVTQIKNNDIYHIFLNNIYSNSKNPLLIEKKFVHKSTPSIFSYQESDGYFLNIARSDPNEVPYPGIHQESFRIHTFWSKHVKDPKRLLQIATELNSSCIGEQAELKEMIAEFILGKKIRPKYDLLKDSLSKDIAKQLTPDDIGKLSENIKENYRVKDLIEQLMKWPIEEKDDLIKYYYFDLLIKSPEVFNLVFLERLMQGLRSIRAKGKHKEVLIEYIRYISRVYDTSRSNNMSWWILPSLDVLDENKEILREIDVLSIGFKNVSSKPLVYLDEVSVTDSTTKLSETKAKFGHITQLINGRFPRKIKLEYYFNNERIDLG